MSKASNRLKSRLNAANLRIRKLNRMLSDLRYPWTGRIKVDLPNGSKMDFPQACIEFDGRNISARALPTYTVMP